MKLPLSSILFLSGCAFCQLAGAQETSEIRVTTPSGLQFVDLKEGSGKGVSQGAAITVNYTGWLSAKGKKGEEIASSSKAGIPLIFVPGETPMIEGWTEGLFGLKNDPKDDMKVGGKRLLYIPAKLAYGNEGSGRLVPPDADLIFEIEVINVE